MIISIWI